MQTQKILNHCLDPSLYDPSGLPPIQKQADPTLVDRKPLWRRVWSAWRHKKKIRIT